jgi:hypothetical protein
MPGRGWKIRELERLAVYIYDAPGPVITSGFKPGTSGDPYPGFLNKPPQSILYFKTRNFKEDSAEVTQLTSSNFSSKEILQDRVLKFG